MKNPISRYYFFAKKSTYAQYNMTTTDKWFVFDLTVLWMSMVAVICFLLHEMYIWFPVESIQKGFMCIWKSIFWHKMYLLLVLLSCMNTIMYTHPHRQQAASFFPLSCCFKTLLTLTLPFYMMYAAFSSVWCFKSITIISLRSHRVLRPFAFIPRPSFAFIVF